MGMTILLDNSWWFWNKEKEHKEKKRKCSVKWIADEQGCEEKNRGWNEGLTSGTMKLIAILRRGGCLGASGWRRRVFAGGLGDVEQRRR